MSLCFIFAAVTALAGLPGETLFLQGDAAEFSGKWADAVVAYDACAKADPELAGYAAIHAARCVAKGGDAPGALTRYAALLGQATAGAGWVRMAEAESAALLAEAKRNAEAAPLFEAALTMTPRGWWLDDLEWASLLNLLAIPERNAEGFAKVRALLERDGTVPKRADAARKLLESPSLEDRRAGLLGLVRLSNFSEVGKALLASPAALLGEGGLPAELLGAMALATTPASDAAARGQALAAVAQQYPANPWVLLWLIYCVHTQAGAKQWDEAAATSDLLMTYAPDGLDAGDAAWWLGNQLEKAAATDKAIARYRVLLEKCPKHNRCDDAWFRIGAIHEAAGKDKEAIAAFAELAKAYPHAPWWSHGCYRCGKLYEKAGDVKTARLYYTQASEEEVGDWFAHRALDKLFRGVKTDPEKLVNLKIDGKDSIIRPIPGLVEKPNPPFDAAMKALENDPRIQRIRLFGAHGLEDGEWETAAVLESLGADQDREAIYRAVAEAGYDHSVLRHVSASGWGMSENKQPTPALLRLRFPLAYWPEMYAAGKAAGVDPYLLLAISKQESTFRARICSSANAVGVMQMIPSTADWLAQTDPVITNEMAARREVPGNCIQMGAQYISKMIAKSQGNLIHATASYNAGPGNSAKWRKQNGKLGIDEYIEAIPFTETRLYVKKVLGNYAAYRSLYPAVGF